MDELKELLAQGLTRDARKRAQERFNHNSGDVEAVLTLAKAHLVEGELEQAERLIERAEERGTTADTLVLRGNLAGQRNDVNGAKELYRQATEKTPPLPEAFFGYAIFVGNEGRFTESLPLFEKAVQLAPRGGVYHYHLARNYLELEKAEQAVQHLIKAIELNPLYPPAYLVLARILTMAGKAENARQLLQEGLKLLPNNPALLSELTNTNLLGGDVGGAFQAASQLAAKLPDDPAAQTNLALMLLAQARYDEVIGICQRMELRGRATAPLKCVEAMARDARTPPDTRGAIRCYEDAMALDPGDWTSANNLGQLLLKVPEAERNIPRAITVLEEAVRRAPKQLEPMLNLALAYARANDRQKSQDIATRLLQFQMPANHPIREQAERLVKVLTKS
jgi:tetratricopeptide (TPR) repeat protein